MSLPARPRRALLPGFAILAVPGIGLARDRVAFRQIGWASWYGSFHHGRRMANGKPFDMHGNSAAHRTLPLGTVAMVTYLATGRSERVRIEDRGPFIQGRILDLSMGTAERVGMLRAGVGAVELLVLEEDLPR